jgi:hypothetical protein
MRHLLEQKGRRWVVYFSWSETQNSLADRTTCSVAPRAAATASRHPPPPASSPLAPQLVYGGPPCYTCRPRDLSVHIAHARVVRCKEWSSPSPAPDAFWPPWRVNTSFPFWGGVNNADAESECRLVRIRCLPFGAVVASVILYTLTGAAASFETTHHACMRPVYRLSQLY